MNPLSIILKHHVDTYRGAVDHGIPQGLALNIINNQLDGDYTSYARKFQKKYNVDMRLGMMLSKMSNKDGLPEAHISAYNTLDGDYYHLSLDTCQLLKSHPDAIEHIRMLQKRGSVALTTPGVLTHLVEIWVKSREFLALSGITLDDQYWDFDLSLDENLLRQGLTDKKLLKMMIEIVQGTFLYPELLTNLWTMKYLSNVLDAAKVKDLFVNFICGNIYGDVKTPLIGVCKLIHRALAEVLVTNSHDWSAGYHNDNLKIMLYVAQYRQWYDDHTLVYDERIRGKVSVNHHELVSTAIENLQTTHNVISETKHPKEVFGSILPSVARNKVDSLVGKGEAIIFPGISITEKLPANWEHISTSYRQIVEGQSMNHCCGGRHYISSVVEGESIFFHVETDEPSGLTVQLKVWEKHNRLMINLYGAPEGDTPLEVFAFKSLDGTTSQLYKATQVKGRFNRNPTDSERRNYLADLIAVSDVAMVAVSFDFDGCTFIDGNEIGHFHLNEPDAAKRLSNLYRAGADIKFYAAEAFNAPELIEGQDLLRAIIAEGGSSCALVCDIESECPEGLMISWRSALKEENEYRHLQEQQLIRLTQPDVEIQLAGLPEGRNWRTVDVGVIGDMFDMIEVVPRPRVIGVMDNDPPIGRLDIMSHCMTPETLTFPRKNIKRTAVLSYQHPIEGMVRHTKRLKDVSDQGGFSRGQLTAVGGLNSKTKSRHGPKPINSTFKSSDALARVLVDLDSDVPELPIGKSVDVFSRILRPRTELFGAEVQLIETTVPVDYSLEGMVGGYDGGEPIEQIPFANIGEAEHAL